MFPVDDSTVLCDGNWEDIIIAADAAGRHAARELAQRCTNAELARRGQIEVVVGPPGNPLAAWLRCTSCANRNDDGTAVLDIQPARRRSG
ncbi:hypothetical protein SAMN05421805_102403 [Saccharopolyspora antimicrobica]|uniref:Uncharacterized protein n=1 Tax=Saccharopolyspora antimicrobica TaxID=455193 RepID=A0A1I4VVM0_9PSEU|nr:hypothetical protein [Saccharopolyspora antimicrobica]SFN05274.1 hypothetical protein SAMN05421805_102403 [Saccharopolyspora antimicrobica]